MIRSRSIFYSILLLILACVVVFTSATSAFAATTVGGNGSFTFSGLSASYDLQKGSSLVSAIGSAEFTANNTIKVVASGNTGGILGTKAATTTKLYLKNTSGSEVTISFSLAESLGSGSKLVSGASLNSTTGRYEGTLANNAQCTISVTSAKGSGNTSTVTLSDIQIARTSVNVTFHPGDTTLGAFTVNGSEVTDATPISYTKDTTVSVSPIAGYKFVGWVRCDSNGVATKQLYSQVEKFPPLDDVSIAPLFAPNDAALYQVGNDSYVYWEDAMTAAMAIQSSNSRVVVKVIGSGILPNRVDRNKLGTYVSNQGTTDNPDLVYTIPAQVDLLLPYGANDTGSFGPTPTQYLTELDSVSLFNDGGITNRNYCNVSLTVSSGAQIDCYGRLNPNSQRQIDGQPFTGVPLGGYGKLILGTETTDAPETDESKLEIQLIIRNGAYLYAYGYVTGTGLVDVESGGTIHELLQVCDWPGATNTSNWQGKATQGQSLFLLTQYYAQNIESAIKLNSGANHFVEAVLTIPTYGEQPFSIPFVAAGSGLFRLGENAYVLRIYDVAADRMNYYLKGGSCQLASITIDHEYISLNSSQYVLGIASNLSLIVEQGATMTADSNFALLPGAELIINGQLNLTGKMYIVDRYDWDRAYDAENAKWVQKVYFFNRATMKQDTDTISNNTPNHCPVPYVATRNGLSPKVTDFAVGYTESESLFGGGVTKQPRYYLDITDYTVSGKLVVNGVLNITGSGAVCTTNVYTSPSANKAITGTGEIRNNPDTLTVGALSFGYNGTITAKGTTYGLGSIASVGKLQPFAKGTYYGQANGYWYNYKVTGDANTFTVTAGAQHLDSATNAIGLISYYMSGSTQTQSTFAFSMAVADGSGLVLSGGGTTIKAKPTLTLSSMTMSYALTGVADDIALGVTNATTTEVWVVASNAKPAAIRSYSIAFPSCVDLRNFFTDGYCTVAASSLTDEVFIVGEAVVAAIGPSAGQYVQVFMNVAEAVEAATGSNNYVTVLLDRPLTTAIVIAKGQDITLDLGGKKLDGGTKSFEPLTNNGTLRLINGTITYAASKGAIVRNNGTIEYIEGVTLNQTYSTSSTSTYAIYNSGGATIREIRSGTFCTGAKSAGYVINNYGTIETIGTYGKTVTITGRRGIVVQDGTITTIGGAGSTVVITSGQRCIEVLKGKKIGTIGMNGSTVTIECSGMSMYRSGIYNAGTITTIGGEGSTLNFKLAPTSSQTMSSYAINITTTGTVTTIGAAGSTISITGSSAQKGQNSETYPDNHMEGIYIAGKVTNIGSKANGSYPASKLTIDVSHSGKYGSSYGIYVKGNVTNLGAEGASISITSIYTGTVSSDTLDEHGYGIKNEGTITNLGAAGAFIEIISNQYGVYNASGITINSITDVVVISTDDTGTYYALYNKGTISMINSGDFHHPNGRNNAVYNPDDQNYPAGYSLSSKTRVITIDGVDYPCYFVHTHTYENCLCIGCDIFRFYATNVNLGNNLDMMFAFPAGVFAEGTDLSGYYALFTHVDGTTTKLEFEDWQMLNINGSQSEDGEDYYVVFYSFPAKQMTDTVSVTIYDGSDKAVSISKTDSIQAYAGRMLKKATTSDALKNVIVTMLNYGSACQVQFGYKTEALANSILDEELRKTYEQKTGDGISITPGAATPSIAGHNLEVESNIIFHIALNGVATGTDVTVSFIGHKGNNVSYTTKVKDNYSVEITGLVVADHARTITLTIGNTTLTTSIDTYISNMGEGEANNVFYAFNQFAAAAYAYQHPKEATA